MIRYSFTTQNYQEFPELFFFNFKNAFFDIMKFIPTLYPAVTILNAV